MHGSRNRSAFTLLEMLVALALVSVIAAALHGSLHIAFKAHAGAEAALGPVRRAELTAKMIREEIESALPPTGLLAGEFIGEDLTDANGRDADGLLFHSSTNVPNEGQKACDIRRVELASEPLGDASVIIRRTTTRLLAPETTEPAEEILCRDVTGFNLRYFDGSGWVGSWNSSTRDNALPEAVEVSIEIRRERSGTGDVPPLEIRRVFRIRSARPARGQGGRAVRQSFGR